MVERLPRFIVLKSMKNGKYLTHVRDDQDYLQFSGTDFGSLHVKFELVPSSKYDVFVHLKCCFNKKYWVCRPDQWRITADAHEMEEDQTKRSCTLFRPRLFNSNTTISFCHLNINSYVISSDQTPFYSSIEQPTKLTNAGEGIEEFFDLESLPRMPNGKAEGFEFFDWESLPILPRYIALKGDCGNYLSVYKAPQNHDQLSNPIVKAIEYESPLLFAIAQIIKATDDPNVYLRFNCKDKGDQTVGNEVFTTPDGKIRLKSNHIGKFWRRSPDYNWIWPDSEDETNNNPDTLFDVVKFSQNKIALKNLGNNKYCQRLSVDGKNDCLNANSSTIPETAFFLVEDLVSKRNIFNVRFDEKAISIYEKEILNEVKSTDINNTEVDQEATMEFEYTLEESQTWTTSNSLKQTVETEITVGPPNVVQGKLKYMHEVTTAFENGKTTTTKQVKKFTKKVIVPPNSKLVADFRVMQALCDIPYSYSQTETLTNGSTIVTHDNDDGLYTSVRTEVHFEASQTKGN